MCHMKLNMTLYYNPANDVINLANVMYVVVSHMCGQMIKIKFVERGEYGQAHLHICCTVI